VVASSILLSTAVEAEQKRSLSMKLGISFANYTWSEDQSLLGDTFGLIVERAERAGLDSLWVGDHFFQIPFAGPPEHEVLEGWTALAYAAGRTNRIRLGTMVTGVTYRHPGLLVKIATTLDVLSHGRLYFGVGAGFYELEHRGLGVPFPAARGRLERLEETLQIALRMWSGDESPYEGKHYQLERLLNSPQAVQRPHPPIVIGGSGERKTLRLVAQYADACNLLGYLNKEQRRHKLEILREHCERLGRPYEQIEKTVSIVMHLTRDGRDGTLSPQAALDQINALAEEGFDHVIFDMPNVTELEPFDVLATRIVPEVGV
jgi:F420-dependent oxidoreductase-like protein